MKREDALAPTLGSWTAAANFDLEEERREGKAVVAAAMPQLIKVLAAISWWRRIESRKSWKMAMEEEQGY